MRLQLVSDVHLEFRNNSLLFLDSLKEPGVDILVVAGDLMNFNDSFAVGDVCEALSKMAKEVVWVLGNHEYYGSDPSAVEYLKKKTKSHGVSIVSEPQSVVTESGQRFLCGTMWYDEDDVEAAGFNAMTGETVDSQGKVRQFSDFKWAAGLAPWVYEQNYLFEDMLEDQELNSNDIVVTHHLPSPLSTPERYRNEASNCFFVSDQTYAIHAGRPKLWLHGHGHDAVDYEIGATRVVSAPVGYPGEKRPKAYKSVLIDI